MPRSFDRTPAPFNDPNQGIEFHIGTAFQQGLDMWKAIIDALGEFAENLVKELIQKLLGLDVDPEQALEDLWNLLTGWTDDIPILGDIIQIVKDFLNGNSFPGVLSISRIANIIQDLIYGAGEFLTAESVTDNPYFDWDSVTPGFISGGSIRATANGTQQVLRTEPFEVFPGQTLELRAASQWTGASATAGSNPVKVGFTPFDADGNPLADVIRGSLQPSGDHGWQWIPVADKWPVPAGVKYVSQLLVLDAGADRNLPFLERFGVGVEPAGPRAGQGSA